MSQDAYEAEYKRKIKECAENAFAAIRAEHSLRPPRAAEDRENGFASWLARWRERYRALTEKEIERTFIGTGGTITPPYDAIKIQADVWMRLEASLRAVAVQYCAGEYVRRGMGDATTISQPEFDEERQCWRVALGVNGHAETFGQVMLDSNGCVIRDLTTTRQEILGKLRDRTSPPPTAANA